MAGTDRFSWEVWSHNLHSTPKEITMTAAATCPRTLTLWTPPHQRLAAAVSDIFWHLHDAWRAAAQRRRDQGELEMLDELDDHLRRDLGLSERAAPPLLDWPRYP
jgi:hypothetical protein